MWEQQCVQSEVKASICEFLPVAVCIAYMEWIVTSKHEPFRSSALFRFKLHKNENTDKKIDLRWLLWALIDLFVYLSNV